MKTKANILAAGMLLANVRTGVGQPTLQFSATTYTVAESAAAVTLTVQPVHETDTVVRLE